MEWKKAALVAMVGMLLMAAFAESAVAGADEVIQLVNDGVNEYSEQMTKGVLGCPRILMECKTDSDCLARCICLKNGFCG